MDLLAPLNLSEGTRVVQFGFDGPEVPRRLLTSIGKRGRLLILTNSEAKAETARRALSGFANVEVVYSPVIEHNPELAPSTFDVALILNALGEVLGKKELINEAYRLLRHGGRCVVFQRTGPLSIGLRRRIRKALTERVPFKVLDLKIGLLGTFAVLEKA
ncbi:MAG: methyltransferase domain-containing protein [Nitrososphaerota archaeon]